MRKNFISTTFMSQSLEPCPKNAFIKTFNSFLLFKSHSSNILKVETSILTRLEFSEFSTRDRGRLNKLEDSN